MLKRQSIARKIFHILDARVQKIHILGFHFHRSSNLNYRLRRRNFRDYADYESLAKAEILIERYREIVSDPLNLLIKKVSQAGYVDSEKNVILHNGHRVPIEGKNAYSGDFADILIINRGVHEPLEEYCFQVLIEKIIPNQPSMLELGSYWAHYSMWFMKNFPEAQCTLVEPIEDFLQCGINNFKINGYEGKFIKNFVGPGQFEVDEFMRTTSRKNLTLLHSDIQGHEIHMLNGASESLNSNLIDYIFLSTHSSKIHQLSIDILKGFDYRIEISSNFDGHTTSSDGFILASSGKVDQIFKDFSPLGRTDITKSSPEDFIEYIKGIHS